MKKKNRSSKNNRAKRINPRSRFSEKRLTSRAGLIPMGHFIDKLGIEETINREVGIVRGDNVDYELGMIFKSIMLGIISGGRHLADVLFVEIPRRVLPLWSRSHRYSVERPALEHQDPTRKALRSNGPPDNYQRYLHFMALLSRTVPIGGARTGLLPTTRGKGE